MSCKISLSDIEEISADLDNILQQERETNSFSTIKLKEYIKSKLEESFQQARGEIAGSPVQTLSDFGIS